MATAATIHGRGALFVRSSLSRPDLLDETAYIAWYENDHIAEVTSTSGIRSARRFVSVDPKADKPYLAMYPMEDIAFTQSQEFRNIRVKSNMLPDDHAIYDLADFDVRYDNLIHVYNHREARGGTNIIILVISQLKDPSEGGISSDELDRWYREEVRSTFLFPFRSKSAADIVRLIGNRSVLPITPEAQRLCSYNALQARLCSQ